MPAIDLNLSRIVSRLAAHYGPPGPLPSTDPFELILWESVAYLVSDDRREQAFQLLRKKPGTKPHQILAADSETLLRVTTLGGVHAEKRAARLRELALIALNEFEGDLKELLKLPYVKAKKALQKFPSIGEPGAEKILLFTRTYPVLGLESNGLRVLLRLGFGEEKKNYTQSYRSVQKAIQDQLPADCGWLIEAHLLLRQHGKELCKTNQPRCDECPVKKMCAYYARMQK